MSKAIDDIKRIRDFLNEAENNTSSASSLKKSREDEAMDFMQKQLDGVKYFDKYSPGDKEHDRYPRASLEALKVGAYGDFSAWKEYIDWILKDDKLDAAKLEKFINDYKNWKAKSSAKPTSAEPAAKAKEPSKLSGWLDKFKRK